jgi:hypothetical protein
MALSEDQKAILRLLAQRGADGYDDLAALMGIGVEEAHARAQEAAAQLESEGIPAPSIPTPAGAGTSAAAPPEQPPEAAPEKPQAEVPAPQAPKAAAPEPRPKRTPPPRPNITPPGGGGAKTAIAAGALVLVALVVILIIGGGDDSGDTGTTTSSEGAINTANGREMTQAFLAPVDGSDAKGVATFGRVKNSLALQVEATGLEPTDKGESYTIWLYRSPRKMLPLASTTVGERGQIAAQVEVPTEVLGYLADEAFDQIDISRTSDAALKASLEKATSERKAPIYTGTDVLRGQITGPIIGAAKRGK